MERARARVRTNRRRAIPPPRPPPPPRRNGRHRRNDADPRRFRRPRLVLGPRPQSSVLGPRSSVDYPTVESFWYFLLTGDIPTQEQADERRRVEGPPGRSAVRVQRHPRPPARQPSDGHAVVRCTRTRRISSRAPIIAAFIYNFK